MLGAMTMDAFLCIQNCCDDSEAVFAVADAFHNLPAISFSSHFRWSYVLMMLENLEQVQPTIGGHYLAEFDKVIGSCSTSQKAPSHP
ncbi:hypothetical protein ETAA8_44490 [Anatilimnocola aggregata]|uniref:Uncharacterized protein n=2 Tax=Anatilimnocola aggregata TaxID=2528021 RepID=A0A517YGI5_9BACT|nr:hypothetical protein ETAA8_44490 [Anatilimnocola aggregata]